MRRATRFRRRRRRRWRSFTAPRRRFVTASFSGMLLVLGGMVLGEAGVAGGVVYSPWHEQH